MLSGYCVLPKHLPLKSKAYNFISFPLLLFIYVVLIFFFLRLFAYFT